MTVLHIYCCVQSIQSGDKEWLELSEISYEQLTEEEQAEGEYKGCTPLHFAVINKDLDSVKGIIQKGYIYDI